MRKLSIHLLLLFTSIYSYGATKTWVGAPGGLWSLGSNWSPAGVPGAGDDLIFNTSGTVTVDAGGPFSINTLTVTGSAAVLFDCGATRTFRFSSTSTVTPALLINAGSTLTVDGSNATTNSTALDLTFGTAVIGSIYGTLTMSNTGGSTGSIQIITNNDLVNYGILTVYSGGKININAGAGNTSSSLSPVPTIVMMDGSVYENFKSGGSFPTGTWQSNSMARASGTGTSGPSFNGSTYGNMEWNTTGMSNIVFLNKDISFNNVNFISTNSTDPAGEFRIKTGASVGTYTMTINGNLDIGVNARLVTTSANTPTAAGGKISLKGNLNNLGTITTSNVTAGSINSVEFTGSVNQNISSTGTISGSLLDLNLNNAAGATLLSAITLPYQYAISSGNTLLGSNDLTTPVINQVGGATATTNHIVTNGTGKLVITNVGAGFALYPIGASTTTFNPMAIFNGSNLDYGARVETGINPSIRYPIAAVNRTWVVKPSGTPGGPVNVNFFYNNTDGNALFNYSSTVEQGLYTTVWNVINIGLTQFGGPTNFQVTTTVSSFGANIDAPMVLGNIPAILEVGNEVVLAAHKQNDRSILTWSVNIPAAVDRFEAERSADGRNYISLKTLSANDAGFTDLQPLAGLNYYRIKMMEKTGKISYSNVAVIINSPTGFEFTGIAPNPVVNGRFKLNASAARSETMDIIITDMQGRVVQQRGVNMIAGFNSIEVNVSKLSKGIYHVCVMSGGERSVMKRLVVE